MKFLQRISLLYLVIPFVIFLFGWVRLMVAIPVTAILLVALWQIFKQPYFNADLPNDRSTNYLLLITFLWVFLSGIGGYAFQNWDHNWRNVVFRDLINSDWPVYFSTPDKGPVKMLVYYVGYWLPAALTGKVFGWRFANSILFIWSWIGVLLVSLQFGSALKTSAVKSILLLIFFSGLDALGTLFFAGEYPTLLPPITHLEIWAGNLQYSSFTSQLFWVFNQAIPAWLCILLIADEDSPITNKIFAYSFCFFFAPLASIGLLPYLALQFLRQTDFKSLFKNLRLDILAAAVIVFLLSVLYFASNTAAQQRGFHSLPIAEFLPFFLLEGGVIWLVLAPLKWRDPRWAVTGLLLFFIPFIQLGSGRDFVMRASIAPLFYLMLMTGEALFNKFTPRLLLMTVYCLLLLGSLTPLYEIDRSVYRSFQYYFLNEDCACGVEQMEEVDHLQPPGAPEDIHPGMLTADGIPTLRFMNDELSKNFIANVRQSFFYRYLARH